VRIGGNGYDPCPPQTPSPNPQTFFIGSAMKPPPPVVQYLLAAVMLGLGGYMLLKKHGPNPWIGVRLPWTLADREIWEDGLPPRGAVPPMRPYPETHGRRGTGRGAL
jgi:hypothetical protein